MAIGDRLVIADKPTLDEIKVQVGETTDMGGLNTGSNAGKLNTAIKKVDETQQKVTQGNDDIKTVIKLLSFGQWENGNPGTYSVKIPETIDKILVTACGGGGAGGSMKASREFIVSGGGGGGGGQAIVDKMFTVTPGTTLSITIGQGGYPKTTDNLSGNAGTATIISNLITLTGGMGGDGAKGRIWTYGGTAGGTGGGNGGNGGVDGAEGSNGIDGVTGKGGAGATPPGSNWSGGGGGGGSLGNGGTSNGYYTGNGYHGGGGSGANGAKLSGDIIKGGYGGDGYVKITWGA